MQYTDPTIIMMLLVLPSLFGLTLIGEGVNKIMNYDNRGWITVTTGSIFVIVLLIAYFTISTRTIG